MLYVSIYVVCGVTCHWRWECLSIGQPTWGAVTGQAVGQLGLCVCHRPGCGSTGFVCMSQARLWVKWVCVYVTGQAVGQLGLYVCHRPGCGSTGLVCMSQARLCVNWVGMSVTGQAVNQLVER
jgi:hypothetical protein